MPLTDTQLKNLKPKAAPYRVADGGGLFIEVRKRGSKLWRFAYRFDDKQKMLALGSYPETSLARAREKRLEAKGLLQDGIDPGAKMQADKEERRALLEDTFSALAGEFLERLEKEGRSASTLTKKRWLLKMAEADLGKRQIREITAAEILKPLRRLEEKSHFESAVRMRAVVGQVFRYAIATGRAENDPTFGLRGAIITPKVTHRAAVTEKKAFLKLVRHVWTYDGKPETQAALKLMVLLYPRPGELRLSYWKEYDLEKGTWTIPATRAKMRREHVKPLSRAAVAVLKDLQALNNNSLMVFPSHQSPGKPISEATMTLALRRMGYTQAEHVPHGFRASASSLLNESGKWNEDAIEAELGHLGSNEVRRAYHRARYWDERVKMAEWWAGEVTSKRD
ncbi:MAG: tyrosine-type recombinase/integrase [Hyphomonas sp.]